MTANLGTMIDTTLEAGRSTLTLSITGKEQVTERVAVLTLTRADGLVLPEWTPGAHITLTLPSGRTRQYSLCGDPGDRMSYEIAVLREESPDAGSVEVHESLGVGDEVEVTSPRNSFPLVDSASSLLIAGGIGITPLVPMARELSRASRPFRFLLAVKSRAEAAVASRLGVDDLELFCSDEGTRLDLGTLLSGLEPGTAVYCCGPRRMLDDVMSWSFALQRNGSSVHLERFESSGDAGTGDEANVEFRVTFARSGETATVARDQSILACARKLGKIVDSSCEEGYCGTCETRVLAGDPEHRDDFLTEDEKASGETMMICVSRSHGGDLTLDL